MSIKIQKTVGIAISYAANLLNTSINKKIKPYGIAIEQRTILELIQKAGAIKQSELTKALVKDKTTISRTLKALENKNYIIKEKIDNKNYVIKLSELGEDVMEKSKKDVQDFRDKISEELTPQEIENLFKTLKKLEKIIK